MRVTGGVARGRRLKRPPPGLRPTSDLVREAIFDALESQRVDYARALDLYAGSGALGIEALSRGEGRCDFVERSAAGAALIRENLTLTGLAERGRVHRFAAEQAPARLEGAYSLVLADPPYDDEGALATLERIASSHLVDRETIVVFEHSSRREAPPTLGTLRQGWSRRYGDSAVSIYRREETLALDAETGGNA